MEGNILPTARTRQDSVRALEWKPDGPLELESWIESGRRLGAVGRGVAWWIGDWLLYGNARFGEKYTRAARITGYDSQSLMNMVYVASRFAPERRRPDVSWSHHAELAALPQDEQDDWLDFAQRNRISVGSLRQELRTARRLKDGQTRQATLVSTASRSRASSSTVVCPACHHQIDLRRDQPDFEVVP